MLIYKGGNFKDFQAGPKLDAICCLPFLLMLMSLAPKVTDACDTIKPLWGKRDRWRGVGNDVVGMNIENLIGTRRFIGSWFNWLVKICGLTRGLMGKNVRNILYKKKVMMKYNEGKCENFPSQWHLKHQTVYKRWYQIDYSTEG